jgi:hypothetical protein
MYVVKQRIYLYFDKTQKSIICTFLRSFVKQNLELSENDILEKFLDDEKYYLQLGASRFSFLESYVENDEFLEETLLYIRACKKYYEYKKSQAPLIAKQKEYDKQKRKFLQEVKMSREKPTKKQLYYYERLCKKYSIEKKNTDELSKLDLRNEIGEIIDEHSRNSVDINK